MSRWEAILGGINAVVGVAAMFSFLRSGRAERRAEDAHRLAVEAHDWHREEVDRARNAAGEEVARRAWCVKTRDAVHSSGRVDLDDVPMEWVTWGEANGYFRRHPKAGKIVLRRYMP